MQLPLFEETVQVDASALARCLQAEAVAIDVETETRWPGRGPRVDYGLSYAADVTVIALAWNEASSLQATVMAAPFDTQVSEFLKALFTRKVPVIAHNAVFDMRQLRRLTDGRIPERIWDTHVMARLLQPAVNTGYSLLSVAAALEIPFPEHQQAMKGQRT